MVEDVEEFLEVLYAGSYQLEAAEDHAAHEAFDHLSRQGLSTLGTLGVIRRLIFISQLLQF